MMGLRIVCVIAAAAVFRSSLLLALAFMVGGAVLPWCAVLIANDRPARNRTAFVGYRPPSSVKQLPRQSSAGPAAAGSDTGGTDDIGPDPFGSAADYGTADFDQPQAWSGAPGAPRRRPPVTIEWLDSGQDTDAGR